MEKSIVGIICYLIILGSLEACSPLDAIKRHFPHSELGFYAIEHLQTRLFFMNKQTMMYDTIMVWTKYQQTIYVRNYGWNTVMKIRAILVLQVTSIDRIIT